MVRIERDYVFDGPNGKASLLELFEGRRQLIIYHFMHHLIHWNELDRGGHFAAFEQPVLFTKNCAIAFALCADTLMVTLGSRGAAVIDECGHDS